mmetsp:Transcript_49883/g.161637  ORF Transcript_49883/g.161637 Transcript_49883/m.161637 type:complete len:251 (-) Transcript_49883:82-834(-)
MTEPQWHGKRGSNLKTRAAHEANRKSVSCESSISTALLLPPKAASGMCSEVRASWRYASNGKGSLSMRASSLPAGERCRTQSMATASTSGMVLGSGERKTSFHACSAGMPCSRARTSGGSAPPTALCALYTTRLRIIISRLSHSSITRTSSPVSPPSELYEMRMVKWCTSTPCRSVSSSFSHVASSARSSALRVLTSCLSLITGVARGLWPCWSLRPRSKMVSFLRSTSPRPLIACEVWWTLYCRPSSQQ